LGIGPNPQSPIPNPQSPIPKNIPIKYIFMNIKKKIVQRLKKIFKNK